MLLIEYDVHCVFMMPLARHEERHCFIKKGVGAYV